MSILNNSWVNSLQAALHLGTTPELLLFYTSRSFQKRPGDSRRLQTHEVEGSTRFLISELDDFNRYLMEPWAEVNEARRNPPSKVHAYLHAESGGCCMRCGSGVAVQTAHIDPWATSRCNHHHNLLRICSACHNEHDSHQSLSTEELRKLKVSGIERIRENLRNRLRLGPSFPTQTPDPVFFGREEELVRLRDSLLADRCLLVHGPGGVGKTQLVLRALKAADTGRPVLWMDAERYDNVEALRAALEASLRSAIVSNADGVESKLDHMQACLVIDGLEQFNGPGVDEIDEWISKLQALSLNMQIIITSQVDLALTRIDYHMRVAGIEANASAQVLSHYLRPGLPADESNMDELISFAGGHPLTLRIAATLINYYGSISAVLGQIRLLGANALKIQKRSSQNRLTSLKICLSLAYDALIDEERRLLYLVANAPGGLFSLMLSDLELLLDAPSAIAGVLRWCLIDVKARGEPLERIYMLSPIASYAISRWREERLQEAQDMSKELARNFAIMAAVIDVHSEKNGGLSNMISRFEEELPNLLRVLDIAEKECGDKGLAEMAIGVCSSLMRYFFVIQLGDIGSKVMLRGTRLALRDGKVESASTLLTLMLTLTQRSQTFVDIQPAIGLMNEIENREVSSQTLGNLALCRAVIASHKDNPEDVETHACAAIGLFKLTLAVASKEPCESFNDESIKNDLSSSYALLGGALLEKRSYAEAAAAYRTSLELVQGQSMTVNQGQLHHQIGNCEANLGNSLEAASRYTLAARQFYEIGMRGYLGNALGEYGNLLIELEGEAQWPVLPEIAIIEAGVKDVATTIELTFGQYPFKFADCAAALRNLFGMVILLSFSNRDKPLAFPVGLQSDLLPWAEEVVYEMDNVCFDEFGGEVVQNLKSLLDLEAAIAMLERKTRAHISHSIDIAPLAAACSNLGYWGGLQKKSRIWMMRYIARRWATPGDRMADIEEQLDRWKPGESLYIPFVCSIIDAS